MIEIKVMRINQKELRKLHQKTLAAEVTTAGDGGSVQRRLALVELYRSLGLKSGARSELTRIWQQFPQHQLVLTAMLDMHVERKTIQLLAPLVSSAQRIGEPCIALRLAIARAQILLRQIDTAAAQYAKLLNAGKVTSEVLLQLAEFMSSHPSTSALTAAVKALAGRNAVRHPAEYNDPSSALLLYVLCRALETENDPGVGIYLDRIQPGQINQPQILFDLARFGFRFGNWDKAAAAAKKVLRISPEHRRKASCGESAESLLVSAHSFAGYLGKAARYMRMLSKSYSSLSLSFQQLTAILEFAAKQQKLQMVSGIIAAKSKEEDNYQIYPKNPEGLSHEIVQNVEEQGRLIGVSVTGISRAGARAWDILVKNDWRFPHVMVQQLADFQILHAFVPSDGPSCWSWQEVPISMSGGRRLAEESQIRFIGAETSQCNEVRIIQSELFKRVEEELMSSSIQKELQ